MTARLQVLLHGAPAGWLVRKENGNLQFRYHEAYVQAQQMPLSNAMPVQAEAYGHRICLAVFGGILPEQDVRRAVSQLLGVSPSNDYRLLEELGGDCAGAIEFHLPDVEPVHTDDARLLSAQDLDRILVELPRRPLAIGSGGGATRMSLAGAQGKLPVALAPDGFTLPAPGGPATTHILKPQPERFDGLVDNEHFCMSLARRLGLPVAVTRTAKTLNGLPYLVIDRYDRDLTAHPVRRLHQEDMCQALGRLTSEKYQADGGPTVREVATLLRQASAAPVQDLPVLWSALILNVLVGNCDAHGKNYSLLYDTARPTLAPLYDIVSTAAYEGLTTRLSMTIGGATHLDDVGLDSWARCAGEVGFNERYALDRVMQLATRICAVADDMISSSEHDNPQVHAIVGGISERATRWGIRS